MMIASYLVQLFEHCPSFEKKPGYDPATALLFFSQDVTGVCTRAGLASEEALLARLVTDRYAQLQALLTSSPALHAFYLVNSLGEYAAIPADRDELGRLRYEASVQKRTGIQANLVLELMCRVLNENEPLQACFSFKAQKSFFFLSHDIDSLYGSLLQDGLWALKHGRFDVLLKLFATALAARPHWFNIDLVMKTESDYGFRSTFYWLVNQGKIDARQTNSDYNIGSARVRNAIASSAQNGFEAGLHKSISPESFRTELDKLAFVKPVGNRYHYLKFAVPALYDTIEESGLKLDASLGFAEHYGFRNNYGYPFQPFNTHTGQPYSFLEVPLTIMDGTFQRYLKVPVAETGDTIIRFLEAHRENALISVLWHNTFFSNYKYKGYLNEYKKILAYLYEAKLQPMNQSDIIHTFSWQKASLTA